MASSMSAAGKLIVVVSVFSITVCHAAVAVAATADSSLCVNSANDLGLQDFWSRFRRSTLGHDYKSVAKMVRFPLSVADVVDDNNVRTVGRASFESLFRRFLASDAGVDTNQSTISEYIARTSCLTDTMLNSEGDSAQASRMVFVRYGASWALKEIFFSYDR